MVAAVQNSLILKVVKMVLKWDPNVHISLHLLLAVVHGILTVVALGEGIDLVVAVPLTMR